MKFVKNFNNNAALVEDDQQTEWIVIGKGVGFGKHSGDQIDQDKIERRFKAADQEETAISTATLLSPEIVEVVNRIEKLVNAELSRTFTDYQYLSLADHIDFAIKRSQDGINLDSATISWETNRLFPKEYAVAKEALIADQWDDGSGTRRRGSRYADPTFRESGIEWDDHSRHDEDFPVNQRYH